MKELGKFIIKDPKIVDGKPVFKGTRIPVSDVLNQISEGMSWEKIIDEWYGTISREAIKEAVELAKLAFENNNVAVVIE